jgi:hypothetical protein
MRLLLPAAIGIGLLAAGALWLFGLRDGGRPAQTRAAGPQHAPRTYAELVAANYKVLSHAQSLRLIRFADEFTACMVRRGIALGDPRPSPTKIVMQLPRGVPGTRILQVGVACGESLGGPPKGASLVQPKNGKKIELYLPKRCLLDKKAVSG